MKKHLTYFLKTLITFNLIVISVLLIIGLLFSFINWTFQLIINLYNNLINNPQGLRTYLLIILIISVLVSSMIVDKK